MSSSCGWTACGIPSCFGYLSPSLAPKEERRNGPELKIYLAYNLAAYFGASLHSATKVGTVLSEKEYVLQPPEPNSQTVWASASLPRLPAPGLLTAGAICAAAPIL